MPETSPVKCEVTDDVVGSLSLQIYFSERPVVYKADPDVSYFLTFPEGSSAPI